MIHLPKEVYHLIFESIEMEELAGSKRGIGTKIKCVMHDIFNQVAAYNRYT